MKYILLVRDEPGYSYPLPISSNRTRAEMEAYVDRWLAAPCNSLCGGCRKQPDGKPARTADCRSVAIFKCGEDEK